MNVYEAIAAVSGVLAREGVSKGRKNQQQGYSFRGIDDMYNALAPVLAEHKLVILPRVTAREIIERQSAKGGALFYVTTRVEFDFVSAADGTHHTVVTYGEAMDSADKATNKAMSAAYKYAAMQAFAIPTEGDNDADAHTPESVVPKQLPALDVSKACKAIREASTEKLAVDYRDNAIGRCTSDADRERVQSAFQEYAEAAMASV